MSPHLRVALVHHPRGESAPGVQQLATALRDHGHEATALSAYRLPVDSLLRRRGFTTPVGHLPSTLRLLLTGGFDIAHAFSAPDAAAALLWRRRTGRPVVYTCAEVLARSTLADGRLRQRLLSDAVQRPDAVIAASEESQRGLERWLAVDAPVIDAGDGAAHERLYEALRDRRSP